MSDKRFRIALSFAGEDRDYVKQVADILSSKFGEDAILYDKFHEAEFSRARLAFYLPKLYNEDSDLVVVFLSADYEKKEWCGLEWDAIFDLIKRRNTEDIMLARFDRVEVEGLYSIAGYTELRHKTTDQTADLILQRLAINEGLPKDYFRNIPNAAVIEETDEKRPKPFFNVPYNSKGDEFVGRENKVYEIWNLLTKEGCAAIGQAVSVRGFGGLGKTQLAVEYSHAKRSSYENGVYWLVADQPLDNQLVQIADAQGWIDPLDKEINQLDIARTRFLQLDSVLIIFDNVDDESAIKPFLPKSAQNNHILITSRERQPSFRQIDLELLERNESRELLLKVSGRELDSESENESIELILDILGGIPLAIELVGGFLAEHAIITFEKYHQFLNEVPLQKLEEEFPTGSFTDHDRSVIQTLRISEKTLKEKPEMVEVLRILSWSGSSSMGTSLLEQLSEIQDSFKFATAIGDACKMRLLVMDASSERYAIHRLLAKVIRSENPLDTQEEWHERKVNALESWFSSRSSDPFLVLSELEAEVEHLETWQAATLNLFPARSIFLTVLKSIVPRNRGLYSQAMAEISEASRIYQDEGLEEDGLLAVIQNSIGNVYAEMDDYENALPHFLLEQNLNQKLYPEDSDKIATCLANLGVVYTEVNDLPKAFEHLTKAYQIRQKLYDPPHLRLAHSLNVLGLYYSNEEIANYPEALNLLFSCFDMRRQLLGEAHPDTANVLNNIGAAYSALGMKSEAVTNYERSLTIYETIFGKEHARSRFIAKNLINCFLESGFNERAGRKAAEYFPFVPQNDKDWVWFNQQSKLYRKNRSRQRKRR